MMESSALHRREWFKKLNDQELKTKCLRYLRRYGFPHNRNKKYKNLHKALSNGFSWRRTTEGFKYWSNICRDMRNNPEKYISYNEHIETINQNYNI